jgi:mRNA interferase YafQ
MREIKYTSQFKRDYRRDKSVVYGSELDILLHGSKLDILLMKVVNLLAADKPLPQRNYDYALAGEWSDSRECHIRPDLILIYRKPDDKNLELLRLGSHSELGL